MTDFERITALPCREVDPNAYVEPVTAAFRRAVEVDTSLPHKLNPTQAWALYELSRTHGIVGAIGVGHGKAGLGLLAPLVVPGCRVALLLVPAALRDAVTAEYLRWKRNFRVPNLFGVGTHDPALPTIYTVSYEQLSREHSAQLLETLAPDLVIADEAHNLKHRTSTRTKRILRYMAANRNTRFCAWSGTLTTKSITNYAHLSAFALRDQSPLPLSKTVLDEWADALDANPFGASGDCPDLLRLAPDGDVRAGFHKRLVSTLGVITTKAASVDCSLNILERQVEVPKEVADALKTLRKTGERPDGEIVLEEPTKKHRCARELSSGFYYKWVFPRGETGAQIDKWMDIRREWHKELRDELKQNKAWLDSPLMLCRAAIRKREGYVGELPVWESAWFEEWCAIKDSVKPTTEAVWLSDFLVEDVLAQDEKQIIWYEHDAFGERLAGHGTTVYSAGSPGSVVEGTRHTYAASIRSHGTGRNLQRFHSQNLIANYPSDSAAWEQLIGRTHRQGQKEDEVTVTIYRHTPELKEALRRARTVATYQQETMGTPAKLLLATYGFDPDDGI